MKHPICQHGEYDPPRCRKRATVAVGYRYVFAHRVTGNGDRPQYVITATLRCPLHERADVPGEIVGTMGISDYLTRLERGSA